MILKLLLNTWMIWMVFIKNIEEYNPNKKRKTWIFFDDMISDMLSNKKFSQVIKKELFMSGRKINFSLAFITQSYFALILTLWINKKNLLRNHILF